MQNWRIFCFIYFVCLFVSLLLPEIPVMLNPSVRLIRFMILGGEVFSYRVDMNGKVKKKDNERNAQILMIFFGCSGFKI